MFYKILFYFFHPKKYTPALQWGSVKIQIKSLMFYGYDLSEDQ